MPGILTNSQKRILVALSRYLKDNFVFAGGTALSEFYLSHRLSEDLDFFALSKAQPVQLFEIENNLKESGLNIVFKNKIFDRCIYSVEEQEELIKIEFVPLYFKRFKQPIKEPVFDLNIESLEDLTANKIMAMVERFELKDFIDIYCISCQTGWSFQDMIELAKSKEQMPYQYTVNLYRIFDQQDKLDQVRFTKVIDPSQIIEFFKKADQDLKKSAEAEFLE